MTWEKATKRYCWKLFPHYFLASNQKIAHITLSLGSKFFLLAFITSNSLEHHKNFKSYLQTIDHLHKFRDSKKHPVLTTLSTWPPNFGSRCFHHLNLCYQVTERKTKHLLGCKLFLLAFKTSDLSEHSNTCKSDLKLWINPLILSWLFTCFKSRVPNSFLNKIRS